MREFKDAKMLAVVLDYFEHGFQALYASSVLATLSRYFLTTDEMLNLNANNASAHSATFSLWRSPSLSLASLLFPFSIAVLSILFVFTWRWRSALRKNSRGELVPVASPRELKHFPKKEKVS